MRIPKGADRRSELIAISELLVRLNQRPFRKQPANRATLLAQLDRPAQKSWPATRYQFGE